MLVTYAKRTGGPMQFEMGLAGAADPAAGGEELDGVKELTQWYNHVLGQIIRTAAEQYWWIHRRWKGTPPKTSSAGQRFRLDPPVSQTQRRQSPAFPRGAAQEQNSLDGASQSSDRRTLT